MEYPTGKRNFLGRFVPLFFVYGASYRFDRKKSDYYSPPACSGEQAAVDSAVITGAGMLIFLLECVC